MKTAVEIITPKTAELYLETMNGNRPVRASRVDTLADQMKRGLWRVTHQGIAFDEGGALVDGQHRLWAIIISNCAVKMNVTRGLLADDVLAIDTGAVRSYADTAAFSGKDTDSIAGAVAKIVVLGPTLSHMTVPFAVNEQWREHFREQIDLALRVKASAKAAKKNLPVPVVAAFARAAFGVSASDLERMGEILGSGVCENADEDYAAILLRDAWLAGRIGKLRGEQYFKTESAIRAFAAHRPIRVLQRLDCEQWKLPELPKEMVYAPSANSILNTKKLIGGHRDRG